MYRIHVANVPPQVALEELQALCRDLGIDGEAHLARDSVSARFEGDAYIATTSRAAADAAVARLHGHTIGGVRLEVTRVEGEEFFDADGLFADGEAPMGRKSGDSSKPDR